MIPIYEERYAAFIWVCYGVTAVVMIALVLWTLNRAKATKRELEALDGQRRRAPVRAPAEETST